MCGRGGLRRLGLLVYRLRERRGREVGDCVVSEMRAGPWWDFDCWISVRIQGKDDMLIEVVGSGRYVFQPQLVGRGVDINPVVI